MNREQKTLRRVEAWQTSKTAQEAADKLIAQGDSASVAVLRNWATVMRKRGVPLKNMPAGAKCGQKSFDWATIAARAKELAESK